MKKDIIGNYYFENKFYRSQKFLLDEFMEINSSSKIICTYVFVREAKLLSIGPNGHKRHRAIYIINQYDNLSTTASTFTYREPFLNILALFWSNVNNTRWITVLTIGICHKKIKLVGFRYTSFLCGNLQDRPFCSWIL